MLRLIALLVAEDAATMRITAVLGVAEAIIFACAIVLLIVQIVTAIAKNKRAIDSQFTIRRKMKKILKNQVVEIL